MNITQIQEARLKLEAVGLLQTFYKNENNFNYYIYCLFAPKSPVDFLNDPLFSRLLREKIGEKQTQNLINLYKNKPLQEGKSRAQRNVWHAFPWGCCVTNRKQPLHD